MILLQEASFKQPRGNWQKRYVQLDFTTSIKELEKIVKELKSEQHNLMPGMKDSHKWLLTAFMKKCMCEDCKPGWKAHEKACE